jgi:hypothetical protein
MAIAYTVLVFVFGALVGAAAYFIVRSLARTALFRSLNTSLFLIKIPTVEKDQNPLDFKVELARFEQLLSGLASAKDPFVFEVAVPHVGESIHFYVSVPKSSRETASKQIQGLWPGASVELVQDDFTIFNSHGASVGVLLKQKENYALPIKTYAEAGVDTFDAITGAFAKIGEIGEGACLQIVLYPAGKQIKKNIQKSIEFLKKGESFEKIFEHEKTFSVGGIMNALNPKEAEKDPAKKTIDEDAIKALQAKSAKTLFKVNVRVVASAGSQFQADDVLEGIAAGFNQFASPLRNEFKIVKPRNAKKLIHQFIYREFVSSDAMILSAEEVASIYHLPLSSTKTAHIKWLKSKEAPAPDNLPKAGLRIGQSVFQGHMKPVYVTDEDRRRHMYIIGQTGTGKSTLIGNMIIEDIQAGKGVAVIDPHGDLVENVLGFVPKERLEDVIYFNPGDLSKPAGLNMLDFNPDHPEEKTFIVNEMQSIFNKLFPPETMGPMFEQYMRNALLLLMEDAKNEPATLIEVPRIFTDAAFRAAKLARIQNPIVVDFWQKEASKAGGDASLANMTPYITSKFNNFISNDYMRPIIGQTKSAFNFREVMDSGKILLINLSKGRIGDINAGLLGMIFTGKILMAALSRVDTPDADKRRDFNLYIDEFQNFTTDSIATILSEARKYRLNLTMAHQFIAQLTDKIKDAVFGNVGSIVSMRIGVSDAEFLVKQFEPVFSENDLVNIDNLNAYVKLLINGQTSKPFNIKVDTTSWGGGDAKFAESLKEYSRVKFGADRQNVEADIFKRLRS